MLCLLLAPAGAARADGSDDLQRDDPWPPDPAWRPAGLVRLAAGPGWRIRRPWRSYGTGLAVSRLQAALRAHHQRFPAAPPLVVYDLSRYGGGPLEGHYSHRRGRDADVGLPVELYSPRWRARDQATERTLYLVLSLLRSCDVEFILIDRELQRLLLHHALGRGVTPEEAALIFQYPGRGQFGILRHRTKHRRHLHVRFRKERGSSEPARLPQILPDRESREELCYPADDRRGPRNLIQQIYLRLYGD